MVDDDDKDLKDKWVKRVTREKKAHKDWRDQAQKAEEAYRDELERSGGEPRKLTVFPIWWSTVQITHAAIYAKPPKPDVRKRNSSQEKSDDTIALALERALTFTVDVTGFDDHGHKVVDDFLVAGCGQAKVELDTEVGEGPVIDPTTQQPLLDDQGQPLTQKIIKRQTCRLRHFHWSKFGWEPGKDWEACDWVYFQHDLTESEIKTRFKVTLDQGGSDNEPKGSANGPKKNYQDTVCVYEIWDRKTKVQLFICAEHETPLESNDDPLKLENFFPCPKPIFTNLSTAKLIPKPDYCFVQSQCDNINRLSGRIHALSAQIKDVGFYDSSLPELAKLQDANDGDRIPIKNLMERLNKATKGDFDQVMAAQDNTGRAVVLRELIAQRDIEKNVVFETLGISDIIRGATQASETAEAQKIKSQWGNVRIGPKVKSIAGFFRDVFRLFGELISEHFEPEQIKRMCGMDLTPEELAILKDDLSRSYAIDIETDSTIAADDSEERTQRLEMVKAMTDYLNVYLPLAQQKLIPANIVKQTLLFVLASFKYGRELQDAISQMPDNVAQLQELGQQLQQCQQQLEKAGQENVQLQQQIQGFDQIKAQGAKAESDRKDAEVKIMAMEAEADGKLKEAQAAKYWSEASTPPEAPPDVDAAEDLKVKWFDAQTRRLAVLGKMQNDEKQAEIKEKEALKPEPDLIP